MLDKKSRRMISNIKKKYRKRKGRYSNNDFTKREKVSEENVMSGEFCGELRKSGVIFLFHVFEFKIY